MAFSEAEMRARFHQAVAERNAIQAKAAPIRESYEATRNRIAELERTELKPIIAEMKSVEAPLHELQMEIARLARALSGKTGEAAKAGG